MLRAVLFDAAGTLLHLVEPVGVTYARLALRFGIEVEANRLQEGFRESFRAMPPMVFPGESPGRIERLERAWWRDLVAKTFAAAQQSTESEWFEGYFDRLFLHFATADAWRVVPGGRDVLAELRQRGLRTAIVSNFDHRLHGLLNGLQLGPLLDSVVLPSDAGAAKPNPRIFHVALQRIGVTAADALYVGDDPDEDIEGARRAGLAVIDVTELDRLEELLERI